MQIPTIAMEGDIPHLEYDGVDLMVPFSFLIYAYNSTCVGGLPNSFSYTWNFQALNQLMWNLCHY